jgi:hypothetical protein
MFDHVIWPEKYHPKASAIAAAGPCSTILPAATVLWVGTADREGRVSGAVSAAP